MAAVFTDAGKAITTNRIIGAGTTPQYVAIGTGAGTAAAADTTLFTETESRVSGTATRVTTTVANDTVSVAGTVTATAARAVTNAGLFDASVTGNLYMKADFATVNLATGDSIALTARVVYA